MDKILVVFEKKNNIRKKVMQKLMESGSGGENVHCEIVIPHRKFIRASAWLSTGVQFKDFYELVPNAEHYEYFEINNVDAEAIYQFHALQLGKKYDQAGLFFAMFLGFRSKRENPDKWFCSEINYYELLNIAKLPLPQIIQHYVTPEMLYIMLKDLGYVPKKLSEII